MLDLLAAISSVDPPALLAWLVLAFAAGMYPVGIMLGSTCSPCCGTPCSQCTEGELPDTLTVTFSGLQDRTPGPDLCLLTFSAPYGGGAAGKVTAPGGDPDADKGPITAVSLTNGGSGYAKFGRVAPTITASGGSGTGATFSVSTTSANDANGIPSWSVTGVTVAGTPTGYVDGDQITFSVAAGDTEEQAAAATINTTRAAPTLSASVTSDAGSGATLSVTLTQTTDYDGRAVWNVSGITATSGGSDYVVGDPVSVTVADGQETYYSYFSASVSSVDGGGAITGIAIDYGGEYFKDDGVIASVTVDAGGTYYREDASASPYVATVTVGVAQTEPSAGTGATLTATVESNTGSENFGKITAVTITSGGTNYLAFEWRNTKCCGDYYNGLSVVCKRSAASPCTYSHAMCGVGNINAATGTVTVSYRGPTMPPRVVLVSESGNSGSQICNTTFTAAENVADCGDWTDSEDGPIECVASGGATATVAAGGEYDAAFRNPGNQGCHICCKGDAVPPEEIEVEIQNQNSALYDGTYVVAQDGAGNWSGSAAGISLSVSLTPCTGQSSTAWGGATYSGISLYDQEGCNECHKTCDLWIVLNVPLGYNAPSFSAENCGGCISTPLCEPPAGTYDLCSRYFLSPVGFVLDCEEEAGPGSLGGSHFKATIS